MEIKLVPTKDDNDGMYYYILPKGSKLYRGDNRFKMREKTWKEITKRPTFFALNQEDAETSYGVTYELITDKEYKLLALDNKHTISILLSKINDIIIRKIIELHYGFKGTRNSNLEDDLKLTNYLCELGYEGYATNKMSTDFGGFFHSEIMICYPKYIHSPRQVTDETKVNKMIEDYKLNRLARETQINRKPKKSVFIHSEDDDNDENISNFNLGFDKLSINDYKKTLFESPPRSIPNRNLFANESYHSPHRSIQNNLFGFSPSPPSSTKKKHIKIPRKSPNRVKKNRTPTKGGNRNKQNKTNKKK